MAETTDVGLRKYHNLELWGEGYMTASYSGVTIVCTASANPAPVKRFILSLRAFYPYIPVIIAIQAVSCEELADFFAEQKVACLRLEPGHGEAHARNACISRAETEFILFCDDDFIFTEKTDLRIPLKALQARPELGIITGQLISLDKKQDKPTREKSYPEKNLYVDEKNHVLISIPVFYTSPKAIVVEKTVYYQCDIGSRLALARKAVFAGNAGWSTQFKYEGWHEDFYLNMKYKSHWKLAWSPGFSCMRQREAESVCGLLPERQADWDAFAKKWDVTEHLDIGSGFRMFDAYLDPNCRKQDLIDSQLCLPPYKDSYLRILPDGKCLASDAAPDILFRGEDSLSCGAPQQWAKIEKAYWKYQFDRATIAWRIARPFIKLEQSLRKRVKRLKLHG